MENQELKSGQKYAISQDAVQIEGIELSYEDMAILCRAFLTQCPLTGDEDVRLQLIQQIRTSTIKSVTKSPTKRWIVLDAISLFKHRQTTLK